MAENVISTIDKIRIYIPTNRAGKIDEDYIEFMIKNLPSWQILVKLFKE